MKPNPLSSLNHLTVPVGMWELLHGMCVLLRGGCCSEPRPASACTTFAGIYYRPDSTTVAGRRGADVIEEVLISSTARTVAPHCDCRRRSPRRSTVTARGHLERARSSPRC